MFRQLTDLTDEIRALRETQTAHNETLGAIVAAVLAVSQAQAEVNVKMMALHERLFVESGTLPGLREPADGESFAWAFGEDVVAETKGN